MILSYTTYINPTIHIYLTNKLGSSSRHTFYSQQQQNKKRSTEPYVTNTIYKI